jgi:hypothetical protein
MMLSVMRTRTRVQPLCWASETALTKQLILEHGNVKLHTMLPTRAWFHPSRFQVFFFQLLNVLFASIFSRFPEGFCKKKCLLSHQGPYQGFPAGLEKTSLGAGVSFVSSRKWWRLENVNAFNDQESAMQWC